MNRHVIENLNQTTWCLMPWSESKYTYLYMYVPLEMTVALTILGEGEFTASSNSDAGKKR